MIDSVKNKVKLTYYLLLLIILNSCSKDSVGTGIKPPSFLYGTWSSIYEGPDVRYTFTRNNIIEEDLLVPPYRFITTNFKNDFPLDIFNIEEEFIPLNEELNQVEGYIIKISRKDGGVIDSILGNTIEYRKFLNVKRYLGGELKETILLDFPGYNGDFLYKE